MLFAAPVRVINKLQRAQNNVARVICQQRKRVNARLLLKSLHWLPIQEHIWYKVALITYKALSTSVPSYELLQCQETTQSLRSTDAPRLFVPRTRTETAISEHSASPLQMSGTRCQSTFGTWTVSLPFETNSRHTFLPHLIHDETYPPQRLCILSLGGLIWRSTLFDFMLCYVMKTWTTRSRATVHRRQISSFLQFGNLSLEIVLLLTVSAKQLLLLHSVISASSLFGLLLSILCISEFL